MPARERSQRPADPAPTSDREHHAGARRSSREGPLRPIDLGRAVGLSAQMVRRLEEWGLLPPAQRSPSGRRLYTPRHQHAILALRAMQSGYGWKAGNLVIRRVHEGDLAGALALVDEYHATLHRRRLEIEETLRALQTLAAAGASRRQGHREERESLQIGEAARRVGVRVSAVRFWEEQDLLQPQRGRESRYRMYDETQVLRLQIVAVLRQAGYHFDAIRSLLDELARGRPSTALGALQRRREELALASERCSRATAALWGYVAVVFDKPSAPVTPARTSTVPQAEPFDGKFAVPS